MITTGMFNGGPKIEDGFAGPLFAGPLGAGAVVIKRGSLGIVGPTGEGTEKSAP
jgi:hypothetical protein